MDQDQDQILERMRRSAAFKVVQNNLKKLLTEGSLSEDEYDKVNNHLAVKLEVEPSNWNCFAWSFSC